MKPYKVVLQMHGKKYEILILVNAETETFENGEKAYHYDVELQTEGKISGDEFQAIRSYLESEGHLDAACERFSKA